MTFLQDHPSELTTELPSHHPPHKPYIFSPDDCHPVLKHVNMILIWFAVVTKQ